MYRVATARGLVSEAFFVTPRRSDDEPPARPSRPFYNAADRSRAERDLAGLPFPRTLALFARRMSARFIGAPLYDERFRMCSMPLAVALSDQRARVPAADALLAA